MSVTGYIALAWGVTVGGIGLYAGLMIRRGRRLSKLVPPADRRWM